MAKKLDREAVVERLQHIAGPALKTIEQAVQGSKKVKCPGCGEGFEVPIPDATALKACFDSLRLLPGIGTTSKVEKGPEAPTGDAWRDLIQALKGYTLPERVEITRQILPEYSTLLARIGSFEGSSAGESLADASN